ncbi:MAG: hypothetical protein A2511_10065 [Deltaproteobacteria bacterium RIFOXYD12_FULL_50_9]|nr:MAG: hypothetical protein A2511_10065 [Deltaproteobacteria bacterium RIFOXYD12_FULL_50_9]
MRFIKVIQLILALCLLALPTLTAVAGDNICLQPNYPELIYDPGNPKTVAPGTSETIRIIGGVPPYHWSSSDDSQYQFALLQTDVNQQTGSDGRTNNLTAIPDAKPCGKVTLTVTDSRPDPTNPAILKPQTVHGYLNEGYKPLEYVYAQTEELQEAAPGSSATITVSGGVPPYTYEISSGNFSFQWAPPLQTETTNSTSVTVININNGCGTDITVSDQCSTVSGYVRGTGQWVKISDVTFPINANCCYRESVSVPANIVIKGNTKIEYVMAAGGGTWECCVDVIQRGGGIIGSWGPPEVLGDGMVIFVPAVTELARMGYTTCGSGSPSDYAEKLCISWRANVYYVYDRVIEYQWQCN